MTVPGPQVTPSGRWVDLAQRVGSALVILVLGAGLLLAPSLPSTLGLAALFGAMLWELTRLVGPTAIAAGQQAPAPRPGPAVARAALSVAVVGGGIMAAALLAGPWAAVLFVLPLALGLRTAAVDLRGQFLAQFALMALATAGLAWVRATHGLGTALWIVVLVVQSDVLGYFVGRSVGGPKFWPRHSPKKTWSGTVAGWIGAALVGLVLLATGHAGAGALLVGPVLVLGGQLGDIAESALKRRARVKDASLLIPGHGGLMDRFDAMGGSLATALLLGLAGLLPVVGG